MALCDTGTRGLLGAVFGPTSIDEPAYAQRRLPLLSPYMLLADRIFHGSHLLTAPSSPASTAYLRIIEAEVTVTCGDGRRIGDRYRLATTLLNHRADPATSLVRLYHERWEIESAFLALRQTLFTGRVLRSADPFGLEPEVWALLTLYQCLRRAMVDVVETAPDADPDRASFTVALQAARDQVVTANGIAPTSPGAYPRAIRAAVLRGLLPARRPASAPAR